MQIHIYIHAHIYIYMLNNSQRHNDNDAVTKTDAGKKTQEGFFNNVLPLTLFVRVRKGCSRVACERELEIEYKLQYLDPTVMTVTLCLSCSLGLPNRGPRGSLCRMLAFFIASYQHLLWTPNSIGVSEGPLGRVWLSLPHLVSSCLELYWQLLLGLELNWVK